MAIYITNFVVGVLIFSPPSYAMICGGIDKWLNYPRVRKIKYFKWMRFLFKKGFHPIENYPNEIAAITIILYLVLFLFVIASLSLMVVSIVIGNLVFMKYMSILVIYANFLYMIVLLIIGKIIER